MCVMYLNKECRVDKGDVMTTNQESVQVEDVSEARADVPANDTLEVANDAEAASAGAKVDLGELEFVFGDDADPEAIRALNDAIDSPGSEHSAEAEEEAAEAPEDNSVQTEDAPVQAATRPWLPEEAKSFLDSGQSMSSLMPGAAHTHDHPHGPQHAQQVQMSLGAATMMLGAKGVAGLGGMLANGGRSINSAVAEYQTKRSEQRLTEVLGQARKQIDELQTGGLAGLDDANLSPEERAQMASQFFSSADNAIKLESLVSKLDQAQLHASKILRKGVDAGMDGDVLLKKSIDPLRRFMDDNKSFLDAVKAGDETLMDRMSGAVTSLFNLLKDLLQSLAKMFRGNQPAGPKLA
ncbi:hypothetical protein SSTU70S_05730 [Stutzerimonas stutzeri]